jgi:hypothetical protein
MAYKLIENSAKQHQPSAKNKGGARKGNQNARKYPLNPAAATKLDKRTRLGRHVVERAAEIFVDLGGKENLSALKRSKVYQLVRTDIYIDVIDDWAFRSLNWIDRSKKALRPILLERNRLIETSLKLGQALGLDRIPKPVRTYADLVREHDAQVAQQTRTRNEDNEKKGTE